MAKNTYDNVELKMVEIQWAKLEKPNDNGKYAIEAINLSDKQVKELKANSIPAKDGNNRKDKNGNTKPDIGSYISPSSREPVTVVDGAVVPIEGAALGRIGNGSIANVIVRAWDWDNEYGKGTSVGLQGIQIEKLVDYDPSGGGKFKPSPKGYVQPELAATTTVDDDDIPFG